MVFYWRVDFSFSFLSCFLDGGFFMMDHGLFYGFFKLAFYSLHWLWRGTLLSTFILWVKHRCVSQVL